MTHTPVSSPLMFWPRDMRQWSCVNDSFQAVAYSLMLSHITSMYSTMSFLGKGSTEIFYWWSAEQPNLQVSHKYRSMSVTRGHQTGVPSSRHKNLPQNYILFMHSSDFIISNKIFFLFLPPFKCSIGSGKSTCSLTKLVERNSSQQLNEWSFKKLTIRILRVHDHLWKKRRGRKALSDKAFFIRFSRDHSKTLCGEDVRTVF